MYTIILWWRVPTRLDPRSTKFCRESRSPFFPGQHSGDLFRRWTQPGSWTAAPTSPCCGLPQLITCTARPRTSSGEWQGRPTWFASFWCIPTGSDAPIGRCQRLDAEQHPPQDHFCAESRHCGQVQGPRVGRETRPAARVWQCTTATAMSQTPKPLTLQCTRGLRDN